MKTVLCAVVLVAATARADTDDVKKQAGKTVDAAGKYVSEKKEDFSKRVGKQLDSLEKDLADMKRSAEKETKKAQAGASSLLEDADKSGAEARRKLRELDKSSGEAWHDLKGGVTKAVDDFAAGVDRARKR